jgi:hypothetical protein
MSSAAPITKAAGYWGIYGFYVNQEVCAAIGASLVISLFDDVTAYFCGNGYGGANPWALWVYYA